MDEQRGTHVPVLLDRCLELLAPSLIAAVERATTGSAPSGRDAVHVDATLGLGGHAEAVLAAHPRITLIGLDRDTEALNRSADRLARYADRIHLVHAVYDELPAVLERLGIPSIDGVLLDLGVSSLQLDEADRGFAYSRDAPLDMRMDQTRGATAADIVNGYPAGELARVLRVYGEEKFAGRIAASIVRERTRAPLTSSAFLAELVRDAIPAAARRTGGHPAKRSFQALRIEVNGELDALTTVMPAALDALAPGGRVVVMSYQSLEDRIVKQAMTARSKSTGPIGLPVELPGTEPEFRTLTRGAEQAGEAEVAANPRAASVRLRAVERLRSRSSGKRVGVRAVGRSVGGANTEGERR